MKLRWKWIKRNLLHSGWLCFNCFMAHIDQHRYIQYGDVWRCKAGQHWQMEKEG